MKTAGFFLIFSVTAACSSSSASHTTGPEDARVATDTGKTSMNHADAAPGIDSGPIHRPDAVVSEHADSSVAADATPLADASSPQDAGGGGGDGGEWQGAAPPSGSTRCGHGTFTQADAMMACAAASSEMLPIDATANCGAVTISGGLWEVWCVGTAAAPPYVRVRYNGAVTTGTGGPIDEVGGWIDANSGGSGMTLAPGAVLSNLSSTPSDIALQSLGNTQAALSGQGSVFLVGTVGEGTSSPMLEVVSGVSISWDVNDGG